MAGPVFFIGDATIPGASKDDVRSVMKTSTDYLTDRRINCQMKVISFPNFDEHADRYIRSFPYDASYSAQLQGGVMISRDVAVSHSTGLELMSRRSSTTTNFTVVSYAFNGCVRDLSTPSNAVHPSWYDMVSYIAISQHWNYNVTFPVMEKQERQLIEDIMPQSQELASGTYMNEAYFRNPKWKEKSYSIH